MMSPPTRLVDDIPLPLLCLDKGGAGISWANQAAQEWLGLSIRRLKGQSLQEIFSPHDPILQACERCQASLAPVSLYDFNLRRTNQDDEMVQITAFPHMEDQIGLIFHRPGHQPHQVRQADPNKQTVSSMGRMLAHEIKNPLAGISGAAQLLAADITNEEGLSLLKLIRSETARIRRLADRMESLGDHDPNKRHLINIHEILTQARKLVQSGTSAHILFTERYDPSLPAIHGDPDTLMQALLNLIKNAAEAIETTQEAGEITLETSFRSGVTRRALHHQDSAQQLPIEIRIMDTGAGIPDHIRNRLFEPFVSSKPTGQGLGLSLVSKIISAHGGLVEHHSRQGQTIFSILLPVPDKNIEPLRETVSPNSEPPSLQPHSETIHEL